MKIRKKVLSVLTITSLFMSSITVFAASASFTQADVDSNSFGYVSGAKVTKTSSGDAAVKVSYIYDADGNDSDYKYVRVKVMDSAGSTLASTSSNTKITKGTKTTLELSSAYQVKGKTIKLYAKGNNDSLDCKITGTFYGDN